MDAGAAAGAFPMARERTDGAFVIRLMAFFLLSLSMSLATSWVSSLSEGSEG